ncbi:GlsB/YeaQ/YmgE family stress response membrane protein [Novosphingobium panipatense]
MTLLLILLVGGIIGWLASILMRTDAQQGVFLNIVVGIVGAVIAGFIITRSSAARRSPVARSTSCRSLPLSSAP